MLAQYEPNVKATIAFLRLLGIKVNNHTVNETLQNHPDWPSLLCVSDSLHKWNVPNAAGRIDKNDIDRLPLPFIAHVHDNAAPLVVVKEINDNEIGYFATDYKKYIREKKDDFLNKWDGVYLVAETSGNSGEPNYNKVKQKAFFNSLIPAGLLFLLVVLSFYFLYTKLADKSIINSTGIYIQLFILLAGVSVTSLLLWYEMDKNNPLLQKVCTGLVKTDCNTILTGKQSKLFNWLSWSEVGFFYFTGSLLSLLFIQNAVYVLAWLSVLALPYTLFSVYYQWKIARQWCILCMAVQVLLILGAVNVMANNFLFSFSQFLPFFLPGIISLYLFPVLSWFAVKPYILQLQQSKITKREYLRIKFNTEIFDTLLKKQTPLTIPADGLGIDIGNANAPNTLIKVCNPYCGPCAKAHPKIDKLLEASENLKVKIIFTIPDDDNNSMAKPVRHLMAIAANNNELIIKKALDDWYLAEKKDYNVFANKYPMNGELVLQGTKLRAMDKWCQEIKIAATPTFFLNGYQLPDAYSIEDIKYFLLE